MIRKAEGEDEAAVLAATAASPALGVLCEMHWRLWRQNHRLPHQFYLAGDMLLKCSGKAALLCGRPTSLAQSEELEHFLAFSGVQRLSSLGWHPPGWALCHRPVVMQRGPRPAEPLLPTPPGFDEEAPVEDVLRVLESGGSTRPDDVREDFWVDFLIRRNHGVSRVFGIWEDGVLVSTAGAYAITGDRAFIANVQTLPSAQNKGHASALVARLCAEFPGHTLQLLCKKSRTAFYRRLGFVETGVQGAITQAPEES